MQHQRSIAATLICLQLILLCGLWLEADAASWPSPSQEALDELHDAEIFRAVLVSMAEWTRRSRRHDSNHRRVRAPSGVCYPNVGCFHDSGVFGYLQMLPSSPEEVSTRFLLFSSRGRSRSNGPIMEVPFGNLSSVWTRATEHDYFNVSAPTKVIVHGFGSSCNHVWVYEMRSALMAVEDCNVICVDWEAGAAVPNYVRAAANTRLVGKQVAMLLEGLNKHYRLPFHKMHLIGFSLGAHVAGFAGAELKNLSRITGLDPAGPLFESQDPRVRLDSSDAMFVDVIHSNGENLILGGLGSWQPMGHVDFYPNGGRMQKGCSNLFVGAVTDIIWSSEVEGRSLCNHRRAYKFFTDSVSPRCHFPSFPCENYDQFLDGTCFPCTGDRRCGNMGYYADRSNGRGTLFLITRDEEPFCAHQYHVRLESAPSEPQAVSYGKISLTLIGNQDINETFTLTQKDDEQLKTGESLSRILVPNPVLQDPSRLELLYTSYSGWWSSGLPTWLVLKVTLTDSFGNSLSVCQKGLILVSGVAVTLPLYPGDCNVPRGNNATTVAPVIEAMSDKVSKINMTQYTPTPVIHIGDEGLDSDESNYSDPLGTTRLDWQPLDFRDSSSNSLEDSRAFSDPPDFATDHSTTNTTVVKHLGSSNRTEDSPDRTEIKESVLLTQENYTPAAIRQSGTSTSTEIREPVLTPKSISSTATALLNITNLSTPRPSAVRTREVSSTAIGIFPTNSESDRRIWIPSSELNPPPLGAAQTKQHWNLAKDNISSLLQNATKRSHQTSPSVTIQLLPQRLAAFLAQAERYARLTFMPLPSTSLSVLPSDLKKVVKDEDPPNQRKPKQFTTIRPIQKPIYYEPHRKPSAVIQPRMDTVQVLVPYTYEKKMEMQDSRYIPIQFPTKDPGLGGTQMEIITITPEALKKNFRSVKIDRSTSDSPLKRSNTDYNGFHPVYSQVP